MITYVESFEIWLHLVVNYNKYLHVVVNIIFKGVILYENIEKIITAIERMDCVMQCLVLKKLRFISLNDVKIILSNFEFNLFYCNYCGYKAQNC